MKTLLLTLLLILTSSVGWAEQIDENNQSLEWKLSADVIVDVYPVARYTGIVPIVPREPPKEITIYGRKYCWNGDGFTKEACEPKEIDPLDCDGMVGLKGLKMNKYHTKAEYEMCEKINELIKIFDHKTHQSTSP